MIKSLLATMVVTSAIALGLPVTDLAAHFTATNAERTTAQHDATPSASHAPAREREPATSSSVGAGSSAVRSIEATLPVAADAETPAQPQTRCPAPISGTTSGAPARTAGDGAITGTTTDDLAAFANRFNQIRVENCLEPVPFENFSYDECMETRLVWMAEDPSTDPASAWGHEGSIRSDGTPSVGCDGNLAGGSDNSGSTVAEKWWDSPEHRASLYRPDIVSGTADVCVIFAMTHGGVPNEPASFTRAAARWVNC